MPGGKSSNQAAAIGKLGGDVSLLGFVSGGSNGAFLKSALNGAAGVDTTHVRTLEGVASGSAMIAVDDHGENCIIVSPRPTGG